VAIGRAGAYAADPTDGFAMEYNPAGFAGQTGLRVTLDSNFSWQGLSFAPANGAAAVSNSAPPFWEPGGAISYGLGRVGPLSGLTFALGGTGPSAIGRESYPDLGPQRYALVKSDYFIAYYSAAVAASFRRWLAAGLTFQLVKGRAKFSQAVYGGGAMSTDLNDRSNDAVATVDVASGFIPTLVAGVTVRPAPRVAIGLSYRPHFTFKASGTLTTSDLPPAAQTALVHQGTEDGTDFSLALADVVRVGVQVIPRDRLLLEGDVVYERWTPLDTIVIHPRNIVLTSDAFDVTKSLPDIVFQKHFHDTFSLRFGAEYALLPGRLAVRGGYLF
jgi:long-subunit fatty acid transport protein